MSWIKKLLSLNTLFVLSFALVFSACSSSESVDGDVEDDIEEVDVDVSIDDEDVDLDGGGGDIISEEINTDIDGTIDSSIGTEVGTDVSAGVGGVIDGSLGAATGSSTTISGGGEFPSGAKIDALGQVTFPYDSFSLGSSATAQLQTVASWLKQNPGRAITVEGHCDERGTSEYNLALGERRAQAVRDHLVFQMGVSSEQLSTISYGEERPVVFGSNDNSWAANRRAEFVNK